MDIAALSTISSQSSLSVGAGVKVLSMVKDQMEVQGQDLVQMMSQSLDPNLGNLLDIKV